MTKYLPFTHPPLEVSSSVAVVGSSAILLDHQYGAEINKFDDVVRFNRAPTHKFEKHVGSKTTLRICNPHCFAAKPFKDQDQYFIRKQKDCKIVVIGPENKELRFENHTQFVDESCSCHKVDISRAYENFGGHPTVGMCFLSLLVRMNIVPHVYGFHGLPYKEGNEGLTHYYGKRENKSPCHNFTVERSICQDLHDEGLINWIKN